MRTKTSLLLIFVMAFVLSGCSLFSKPENLETVFYDIRVINGQGGGRYQEGEFISISPDNIEGKVFSLWMVGDTVLSESINHSFTVLQNMEITAIYIDEIEKFMVTTLNRTGQVLEGLGEYEKDSIVTVKANSPEYLVFLYWEFNGAKVANTLEYSFKIIENVEINPIYDLCSPGLVFKYDSKSDSYHVTGYDKVHTYQFDMSIPEHYNDGENGLKPVSEIKEEALSYIRHLRKVQIGKAVTKIGRKAFFGNSGIIQVTLSENLEFLGEQAFSACYNLKEITIPKKVNFIASDAFSKMTSLENILVDDENQNFMSVNGILFSKNGSTIYRFPQRKGGLEIDYEIPARVTHIGKHAFDNVQLNKVTFSKNTVITKISEYAFSNSYIKELTIPNCVQIIESKAFYNCRYLNKLLLNRYESSLTTISSFAFFNCTYLKYFNFPENLQIIENNAFEGCTNLGDLSLPKLLEIIGDNAFANCSYFREIFIAETVTYLGENVFLDTDTFGLIYLASDIIISQLSETAFNGLIENKNIYIPTNYLGELPDYIKENYTKDNNIGTARKYFKDIWFQHYKVK